MSLTRHRDPTLSRAVAILAALLALFLPSSMGGLISPILDRLAIVLNALALGVLLLTGRVGTRVQVVTGALIMGWLAIVTLLSPNTRLSAGATLVFTGFAMLSMLDIREVCGGAPIRRTMAFINVFTVTIGLGLSLDVGVANRLIKTFYSSFYPDLLTAMIDWHHKPVLTFATHSTAGFFFYLFFYMNFRRFTATGSLVALGFALAILPLGFNLRCTTSTVLMALASIQLAWEVLRRRRPWRGPAAALTTALAVGLLIWTPRPWVDFATHVIQGDRGAGLQARFSEGGTVAGNLRYLHDHPFEPIGLTYGPPDLFYGDSGIVLLLVRGSVPLLLLTYLAFANLLLHNLRNRRDAFWLFVVTCAFEVGYTPLQLFRFTSFLPFVMVFLNDLPDKNHPEPSAPDGARTGNGRGSRASGAGVRPASSRGTDGHQATAAPPA